MAKVNPRLLPFHKTGKPVIRCMKPSELLSGYIYLRSNGALTYYLVDFFTTWKPLLQIDKNARILAALGEVSL